MLYHTGRTEVVDPETGDIEERQATPHLDIGKPVAGLICQSTDFSSH